MRRWNTHYITKQCSLQNPVNTAYGGAGYLTQQIYCLYGHVSDCYVANARHLNDFTASAYCMVENCHATGQSAEKAHLSLMVSMNMILPTPVTLG